MAGVAGFEGRDLELELLDAGSASLVRLFRHPKGEWDEPPAAHRKLRVDPPPGYEDQFAVLYTADTLTCVAAECHVLSVDAQDRYWVNQGVATSYQVARYNFTAPALFIPIDGRNTATFGLGGSARRFDGQPYLPYQELALELFSRYGELAHGLSWDSFHRNQLGRVYAIWHHRKAALQLLRPRAPHPALPDDPEWSAFLKAWPIGDLGA